MSETITITPVADYMEVLEKAFAPDESKQFMLVYSTANSNGVRTVEAEPTWFLTDLLSAYGISAIDKILIEKCVTYWAAVGGFIKIKVDGRDAVIVRTR